MKKINKWLSGQKWIYKFAVKLIANRIENSKVRLSRSYLVTHGWQVEDEKYWVQDGIKYRDKIWIEFEYDYYRVFHGEDRTFIALESSFEWFENYYILVHGDILLSE